MKIAIILIVCVISSGCAYNRNHVSRKSDLRNFFEKGPAEDQVRARLIELTPLGTPKDKVREVTARHFKHGRRAEPEVPGKYDTVTGSVSFICVRFVERGEVPFSSFWSEAIWYFNSEDILIEIQVAQYAMSVKKDCRTKGCMSLASSAL